ncbi:MAG: SDR family NAD(P)-dependent oxidoreductase [Alphaproteobacteria bacterium]|nr:SDR family NAD(P)-dependent oxidoreductase [Alphaproteobacteria bacterium]MCB9930310.1 SDR family NAD(P)-dependent oxidoreductase [Alphaproteobacteria bacterium]
MRLEGKTALITGAGSGIGRALAVEAAGHGMAVALVGRRREPLQETRTLMGEDASALLHTADITAPDARRGLVQRVAAEWGRVDFLVNNAGLLLAGPVSGASDRDIDRLLATNVAAPLAMAREFLPLLLAADEGRIVNVGSMLGDIPMPLFAAYCGSKFALRGLSTALRRELEGLGIRVTYAAPRAVRTEAAADIGEYLDPFAMTFDTPGRVARQIWRAAARGRKTVYPGRRERLFCRLEQLVPSVIDRSLRSQLQAYLGRKTSGGYGTRSQSSANPKPVAFEPALKCRD